MGLSQREETQLRIERLMALLEQSNQLIIGLGQYVPNSDTENRRVMEEVIKTNTVVLQQEHDAQHKAENRSGIIFTFDD